MQPQLVIQLFAFAYCVSFADLGFPDMRFFRFLGDLVAYQSLPGVVQARSGNLGGNPSSLRFSRQSLLGLYVCFFLRFGFCSCQSCVHFYFHGYVPVQHQL